MRLQSGVAAQGATQTLSWWSLKSPPLPPTFNACNPKAHQLVVVLQAVVAAQGHYLDPELAGPHEPAFVSHRLDTLQAEVKFTHNAVISRLQQPQLIRSACLLSLPAGMRLTWGVHMP